MVEIWPLYPSESHPNGSMWLGDAQPVKVLALLTGWRGTGVLQQRYGAIDQIGVPILPGVDRATIA
jgi:hypothetical protein